MPRPGKRWFHVTINTHNSWLPADARGFRSRHHKLHSSGDYKHRPPEQEHAGLRAVQQLSAGAPVVIPARFRLVILDVIRRAANRHEHRLTAIAVSGNHGHLLIELPREQPKTEVGKLKRAGSLAVRDTLPGTVWSRGCNLTPIPSRKRQQLVIDYILKHHMEGAATWRWGDEHVRLPG